MTKNKLFLTILIKKFALLIFPFISLSAVAATEVCGSIFQNTVWTASQSPYILTCDVGVFPGYTLTIEEGVTVKFNTDSNLIMRGTLIASGTETNHIIFTADSLSGSWTGIDIEAGLGEKATFDFADFTNLTKALSINGDHAASDIIIKNSTFTNNYIALDGFGALIYNSVFKNNHYGLNQAIGINVFDSIFENNFFALSGGRAKVIGCKISNNNIGIERWWEGFTLYRNTISSNNIGITMVDVGNYNFAPIAYNNIFDNKNYNFEIRGPYNIPAFNNWWGNTDQTQIEAKILDAKDNANLGLLLYQPFLSTPAPENNSVPVANAGTDQKVLVTSGVTLDGSQSYDPDNAPASLTYTWTQTAGPHVLLDTDEGPAPSRAIGFWEPGTYSFSLVVNDGEDFSLPDTITITVVGISESQPVSNAGPDQFFPLPGTPVTLNGSSSYDPDNYPSSLTYLWIQEEFWGPKVNLTGATTSHPTFTPQAPGVYRFSLVVNDGATSSLKDIVDIDVNSPPIANAGPDQTGQVGNRVILNGGSSYDPIYNGTYTPTSLTYHWSQTSGPETQLIDQNTVQPSFTPLTPGTYVFSLVVNDGAASSTADSVTVTVNDADYVVMQSPNGGEIWNEGSKQTITWSSHHFASTQRLQIYLSLDSGSTWKLIASPKNLGYKTWNIPKNRYVTKQALIKVCVKNNPAICYASDSVFTINDKPVAEAGVKQKVAVGNRVILDGGSSYDNDSGPLSLHYYWTQVSGPVPVELNDATTVTPSFTPTVKGLYKFSLIVNDGAADSKKDKMSIRVVDAL